MDFNYNQYSQYKEKRAELSSLMDESSKIVDSLAMPEFAIKLKRLSEKVANETFKIQVVGTFKNGKSTFINALIGEDVLPTRVLPCTAVVNEIKYGDKKLAILHFRNPLPQKLLDCIPEKTLKHMRSYDMNNVPPMVIEYDKIDQYVTIPIDGDPEEISATSPYESVELFYPSPLLKEGVEIIDSPGLNEADERTKCTLDYLERADAIIYLFDALHACAKDEMATIEDILIPKGFNDMFFVVNRFDLVSSSERPSVKKFVEQKAGKLSHNEVYCISALKGLEGKVQKSENTYAGSGMLQFEERLTEFLTKEKGRIKLAQPARELNRILSKEALFHSIPNQRKQLSTSLGTLQNRYLAAKPRLDELEERKKQMFNQMLLRTERSMNDIHQAFIKQFKEISVQVPAWVQEYSPEKEKSMDAMRKDILKFVSGRIREKFTEWNIKTLNPMMEEKSNYIFELRNSELNYIYAEINNISGQISGQSGNSKEGQIIHPMIDVFSKESIQINDFDYKKFTFSLSTSIGVGAGLFWLLSIPVGGAMVMGVMMAIRAAISAGKDGALNKLKKSISSGICETINKNSQSKADEYVNKIRENFINIAKKDVSAIDAKVKNEKAQVEATIRELEKGKVEVEKRNHIIDECEAKLRTICGKLDSLVYDLAELK